MGRLLASGVEDGHGVARHALDRIGAGGYVGAANAPSVVPDHAVAGFERREQPEPHGPAEAQALNEEERLPFPACFPPEAGGGLHGRVAPPRPPQSFVFWRVPPPGETRQKSVKLWKDGCFWLPAFG